MGTSITSTVTEADLLAELNRMIASGEARAIRKASGLSGAVVGRSVGVHTSVVLRWETGDRRPCGDGAMEYLKLMRRLKTAQGAS